MAGVKLTADSMEEFAMSALRNVSSMDGSRRLFKSCDDADHVVCYLIDDGGFLIASNQDYGQSMVC